MGGLPLPAWEQQAKAKIVKAEVCLDWPQPTYSVPIPLPNSLP